MVDVVYKIKGKREMHLVPNTNGFFVVWISAFTWIKH